MDKVSSLDYVVAHGLLGGTSLVRQLPGGGFDERLNTGTALALTAYDNDIGHTIASIR